MTPGDAVLAYDADHGWHLIPSFVLAARYGDDFDRAALAADLLELLPPPMAAVCRHERAAVERNRGQIAEARAEGLTDRQIAWALDVPVEALVSPVGMDLVAQLGTSVQRTATT